MNPEKRLLPFFLPLSLFEPNLFTKIRSLNPRVLSLHRLGFLSP
jgi:hypothetical protein